jgi:hypothetical protein
MNTPDYNDNTSYGFHVDNSNVNSGIYSVTPIANNTYNTDPDPNRKYKIDRKNSKPLIRERPLPPIPPQKQKNPNINNMRLAPVNVHNLNNHDPNVYVTLGSNDRTYSVPLNTAPPRQKAKDKFKTEFDTILPLICDGDTSSPICTELYGPYMTMNGGELMSDAFNIYFKDRSSHKSICQSFENLKNNYKPSQAGGKRTKNRKSKLKKNKKSKTKKNKRK